MGPVAVSAAGDVAPPAARRATGQRARSMVAAAEARNRAHQQRHAGGPALVSLGRRVDPDPLAAFHPAVVAIRWGTATVCLALATATFSAAHPLPGVAATTVLLSTALLRTLRPLRDTPGSPFVVALGLETAAQVAAVLMTGGWASPFALAFVPAVVIAGFARGTRGGLALAAAVIAVVGAGDLLVAATPASEAVDLVLPLLLVAVVAGWCRRIVAERDLERAAALGEAGRLGDANALLVELHALTQTLPNSLDLDEALDATVARVQSLLDPAGVTIVLLDDTDGSWQRVRHTGAGDGASTDGADELVAVARRALRERRAVIDGTSIAAPLQSRGAVIGLIVVDAVRPGVERARAAGLLEGLVEPAALAVDNARWFARLRTVGAEEERSRIARDLHDRIGQSLAYTAFELDRLVRRSDKVGVSGEELAPALDELRRTVRGVIGEVRDTLYDLRTEVTAERGLAAVLEAFVARLRDRSPLEVRLTTRERERAPLLQERELLRIAQEALHNVERHARATHATVSWRCDGVAAELVVADDGVGLAERVDRSDSFGLAGMRERATSIGARLDIDSGPGRGTTVRCTFAPAATTRPRSSS